MRGNDLRTVVNVLLADDGEDDALAAVVAVDLHAGLELHAGNEGHEAGVLRHLDGGADSLALGLCGVDELHVVFAVAFQLDALLGADAVIAVLGRAQQGLAQFFGFFTHGLCPPCFYIGGV